MPEICRPACPRAAGLGNTTDALDCDCGSYVLQITGVVISAAPTVWEYSNVRPTRALLLENLHPLADTVLEAQGIEIERRSGAMDEEELITALQDFDLLGIRSKTRAGRSPAAQ